MDGKATPAEGSFTIVLVQLAASNPHVLENILYCALDEASVPKVCNTVATPPAATDDESSDGELCEWV